MPNRGTRRVGRGLSKYVRLLVGYPHLLALLEHQQAMADVHAATITALDDRLQGIEDRMAALTVFLTEEIDRLDGYLDYQAEHTRQLIEKRRAT